MNRPDDRRVLRAHLLQAVEPVRRVGKRRGLTLTGHTIRLALVFLMLAAAVIVGSRLGPGGGAAAPLAASIFLYPPTARSIFAMLGLFPVGLYGAKGDGTARPATPFQNAHTAAAVSGGTVIVPPGTYYVSDAASGSVFKLPRDNAGTASKVLVLCDPGVTIKLSALTPRLADLNKQSDYDWFRNFEFDGQGCTIDANNISGQHHVLIGTYVAGAVQSRMNYERIMFRRLRVTNVYTDTGDGTTHLRHAVWLSPLGDAVTDTYGRYCAFEDIDIAGGHGGITVGNAGAGSKFHWDELWSRRCRHDRGVVSETSAGANSFYIGSRGVGGNGGVEDCYSRGAPDCAYEINGAKNGIFRNCTAVDPANNGFLHRGANGGVDPADPSQYTLYSNCRTEKVERTGTLRHFKLGVDTAGDYDGGTVELVDNSIHYSRLDNADLNVINLASPNNYRALIVRDLDVVLEAGASAANTTGSTLVTSLIFTDRGNGGLFKIRGLNVKLSGAVGVGAGLSRRVVADARGNWLTDWEGIVVDDQQTFTGGTPTIRHIAYGVAGNAAGGTSTLWGRIRNVRGKGNASVMIEVGTFANQVFNQPVQIDDLDCRDLGAGTTPITGSGTNLKFIVARNVLPRGTFAFPSVASAATLTLPAYDVYGEIISVTGTTGTTAITASWAGRVVRLAFTGVLTLTDNGTTLNLAGNLTTTNGTVLTLYCDGTNWAEAARSVN